MKSLFLLGVLSLLPIFGTAFAVSPDESCLTQMHNGHSCFTYEVTPNHIPSTSQHPPFENINPAFQALNWVMNIFAPDGSCNVNGVTLSSGTCSSPAIVLSDTDFQTFKTNVSVLAVEDIQNSAMPSQPYCPVAAWTWGTQDILFHNKYNMTMVIPPSCFSPSTVPDFTPSIALAVMMVSMIASIGFSRRK